MCALIAFALVLLAVFPARASEPGWTGRWDTRWRDGGARIELTQRGNRIIGSYPAYGGQIEGEVTGRELRGHWIEGKRTGGLSFVLAPDGQSFMGRFDTGEWWTGGRVQPGLREVAVDQAGARQALRTFVLAGNAARAGNPDEWAKAAAVTEFGDKGAGMAPGQKLAAVRTLFEMVDQTTFQLWAIPGRRAEGSRIDLELHQAGTGAVLPLSLVRGDDKLWRVAMPDGVLSALVPDVPHVQPGSVQAGVASITPDGIEVEVSCCLDVRSAADEQADKTALMLGVLRLADRMRVRLGDLDYATPELGAAAEWTTNNKETQT